MTESMPPIRQQMRQLNRSLTEKVLDRAASDPTWKQQLIDDPELAMREANFPELEQLEQLEQGAQGSHLHEVRGQVCGAGTLYETQPVPYGSRTSYRCYYSTYYERWACRSYPRGY